MSRRRWSKLQKALYNIIDKEMDFQMHCVAYPMRSRTHTGWAPVGNNSSPRFWITIGHEIVWDFPRCCPQEELDRMYYPYLYWHCADVISNVIRDYIDCPRHLLLSFGNGDTRWGLIPILQACDRRIAREKRRQINCVINK